MNIEIIMVDNRPLCSDITKVHNLCAIIAHKTALKYNAKFTYYVAFTTKNKNTLYTCNDPVTKEPRHASWAKVIGTYEHFKTVQCNYVLYIDTDIFLASLDDSFLNLLPKDRNFGNNDPWGKNWPCAGWYLLKNNETNLLFLEDWYKNKNTVKNTNISHPWEQEALYNQLKKYDIHVEKSCRYFAEGDKETQNTTYSSHLKHFSKALYTKENYYAAVKAQFNIYNDHDQPFCTKIIHTKYLCTDKYCTEEPYMSLFPDNKSIVPFYVSL
jgi:hypothetical protein